MSLCIYSHQLLVDTHLIYEYSRITWHWNDRYFSTTSYYCLQSYLGHCWLSRKVASPWSIFFSVLSVCAFCVDFPPHYNSRDLSLTLLLAGFLAPGTSSIKYLLAFSQCKEQGTMKRKSSEVSQRYVSRSHQVYSLKGSWAQDKGDKEIIWMELNTSENSTGNFTTTWLSFPITKIFPLSF